MPGRGQWPNNGRTKRRVAGKRIGRRRLNIIDSTSSTYDGQASGDHNATDIQLEYFWANTGIPFVARAPRRKPKKRTRVVHLWEIVAAPAATPGAVDLAGTAASAFSATGQLTRSVPYAGRAGSVFNAKGSTLTTGTVTAVRRVVGVGRRRWAQRSHGVRRP